MKGDLEIISLGRRRGLTHRHGHPRCVCPTYTHTLWAAEDVFQLSDAETWKLARALVDFGAGHHVISQASLNP